MLNIPACMVGRGCPPSQNLHGHRVFILPVNDSVASKRWFNDIE